VGGGRRFSPAGLYVAYHAWRENRQDNDIFVIDVATGEEHSLAAHPADDEMSGWAADRGHILTSLWPIGVLTRSGPPDRPGPACGSGAPAEAPRVRRASRTAVFLPSKSS